MAIDLTHYDECNSGFLCSRIAGVLGAPFGGNGSLDGKANGQASSTYRSSLETWGM